jgi:hypothetical protein
MCVGIYGHVYMCLLKFGKKIKMFKKLKIKPFKKSKTSKKLKKSINSKKIKKIKNHFWIHNTSIFH